MGLKISVNVPNIIMNKVAKFQYVCVSRKKVIPKKSIGGAQCDQIGLRYQYGDTNFNTVVKLDKVKGLIVAIPAIHKGKI